jgi:hypothetical protein
MLVIFEREKKHVLSMRAAHIRVYGLSTCFWHMVGWDGHQGQG